MSTFYTGQSSYIEQLNILASTNEIGTIENSNTTTTATAASLLVGIRTGTPAASINLQIPTGTDIGTLLNNRDTNQVIKWSIINLAAVTYTITVTSNTDHTLIGNMVVSANSSGRFATKKVTSTTFITYRIA